MTAAAIEEDPLGPAFQRMDISSFEIDTVDTERVEAAKAARAAAKKSRLQKQRSTNTDDGSSPPSSPAKPKISGRSQSLDRQMSLVLPFKVMVAVDPYRWSTYAFDWYLKNAHHPDNEVICYHTMERPVVHGDEFCVNVDAFDAVMKGCESNAKDMHNEYTRKMQEHEVNGRVVVQFSVIGTGEAIVEAAQKEKVHLVIVGSRGKGPVRRKLMGSVSDHVLHHAHCTVIVCCQERPRRRSSRLSASNSFSEEEIV